MNREYVTWIHSFLLLCFLPTVVSQTTSCYAFSGETVILPCATNTSRKMDVPNSFIYWQINNSVVVHYVRSGKDQLKDQDGRYHNRTRLFLDQLEHGNFSLIISGVQPTDEQNYTCIYTDIMTDPPKHSHVYLHISDKNPIPNEIYVPETGQIKESPSNCPADANNLDNLIFCFHLLAALVVWNW